MMECLIAMLILVVFALIALRWGCDSREVAPDSDWEKRRMMNRMASRSHL